jgi:transcriptional regulator with XRE-family HTH domain
MNNENIGRRLDEAMTARNITNQSKLARMSGVPQSTINRILKGAGRLGPQTETLRQLATTLAVHLRWLQEGLGPRDLSEEASAETKAEEVQAGRSALAALEIAQAADEVLQHAMDLLETYRSASPTDRERIDLVIRQVRTGLGNKAKARTS